MTREEAITLIRNGKRLTHTYFSPEEWIADGDCGFVFEDGCQCTEEQFWWDRTGGQWEFNWTEWKGK